MGAYAGKQSDLVLVFFDPIGQALCRRTLDIVHRINAHCPGKLRYYLTKVHLSTPTLPHWQRSKYELLSKADEAGGEADRQRVLMQIVQELCRWPGLNRAGFDMPVVFIPDEAISRVSALLHHSLHHQCHQTCRTARRSIKSSG